MNDQLPAPLTTETALSHVAGPAGDDVARARARMQQAVDDLRAAGRGMMADTAQAQIDSGALDPVDRLREIGEQGAAAIRAAGAPALLDQVDGGASIGEIAAAGRVHLQESAADWYERNRSPYTEHRGPATFADQGVRVASTFTVDGQTYVMDHATRRAVLERLDVQPWRVPAEGLLEYDPAHHEWRVELLKGDAWSPGGTQRVIVRRYAGRRSTWSDLSPYIVGGDQPGGPRVYFSTDLADPPTTRDLAGGRPPAPDPHAALVARWRQGVRVFDYTRRPRPPRRSRYSVTYGPGVPMSPGFARLVDEMGTKLADAAAPVGRALVHITETAAQANAGLRAGIESMQRGRYGRGA